MKIKKWLRDGNCGLAAPENDINSTDDLLDAAGHLLDDACSHDIVGEVLFEGEDGKTYAGTVEFVIAEAAPAYVGAVLPENEEEGNTRGCVCTS